MKKRKPAPPSAQRNPDIETLVSGTLTGLSTAKWPERRLPEFRVSSFPYCPLLFSGDPGDFEAAYTSAFYFEKGTETHSLIQWSMAHSVSAHMMYGHWACSKCDEKEERLVEWTTKPDYACKKCGKKSWKYVEVTVAYKGIEGHVDMILRVPDYSQKADSKLNKGGIGWRYCVIDYKTTSLPEIPKKYQTDWTARDKIMSKKYPVPANVVQIRSYAALLRRKYKLNVCGTSLAYLDRSGPVRSKRTFHLVTQEWSKNDDKLWMGRIDRATETHPTAFQLRKAMMEGKKPSTAKFLELVEKRPCRSRKDHDEYMAARFYYDDTPACPFSGRCCSPKASDKKLAAFFAKTMSDQWATVAAEAP